MSQKIDIVPIDLECQKPTEVRGCWIELFNNHLEYHIDFFADEPIDQEDLSLGWETVYNGVDTMAMKKNIAGIEVVRTKNKKWGLFIMIDGFPNDIKAYFNKRSQAQELYHLIYEWLIA